MPGRITDKVVSLETFLGQLPRLNEKMTGEYYYRGQSNVEYVLLPSALRGRMEEKEHEIYTKIMTECSQEFEGIISHGEILSKMQHYGVPTRLLDITSNPIVALYFACEDDKNRDKDGVVYVLESTTANTKIFDSDTISILSCLPRFGTNEKNAIKKCVEKHQKDEDVAEFNKNKIIKRLLHEVKKEKPAFENIIDPEDLLKDCFFIPKKNNVRIIRQSGAFVIFGMHGKQFSNNSNTINSNTKNTIVINKDFKDKIIDQLSCFGVSKATLYPELYKVAESLNEKYRDWHK